MPVTPSRMLELYDKVSYRLTRGYKSKLERLAELAGFRSVTAYLEGLIDAEESRAERKSKKDQHTG